MPVTAQATIVMALLFIIAALAMWAPRKDLCTAGNAAVMTDRGEWICVKPAE